MNFLNHWIFLGGRVSKSEAIQSLTNDIIRNFSISAHSQSIPRLLKLRTAISKLEDEYWKENQNERK